MAATISITNPNDGGNILYDDSDGASVTVEFEVDPDGRTDLHYQVNVRRSDGTVLTKVSKEPINLSGVHTISETFRVSGGADIDFEVLLQDDNDFGVDSDIITIDFLEPVISNLTVNSSPSGTYTVSSGSTASVDWDFEIDGSGTVVDGDWDITVDSSTEFSGTYSKDNNDTYTESNSYGAGSYSWAITVETNEYYYDGFKTQSTSDSGSFTVEENDPATFDVVSIDGTNSPVYAGNILDVDFTVENTGDESGTKDVYLNVGGVQRDSVSLSLNSGEIQSDTLSWDTSASDDGSYTAEVTSDTSKTTSVSINSSEVANIIRPSGGENVNAANPVEFRAEYYIPDLNDGDEVTVEAIITNTSTGSTKEIWSTGDYSFTDANTTETVSVYEDDFLNVGDDYSWETNVYLNSSQYDSTSTTFSGTTTQQPTLPTGYDYYPNSGNVEDYIPVVDTTVPYDDGDGKHSSGRIRIPNNISQYSEVRLKVLKPSNTAALEFTSRTVIQGVGSHDHGQKSGKIFAEFSQSLTRATDGQSYEDSDGKTISVPQGERLPTAVNVSQTPKDVPDPDESVTVNELDSDSLVYSKVDPDLTEVEIFVNGSSIGTYSVDSNNPLQDVDIASHLNTPGDNQIRIVPQDGTGKLRGNVTVDHVFETKGDSS